MVENKDSRKLKAQRQDASKGFIINKLSAEGGTRTRTPRGATPSRWCVCQFHHFGEVLFLFRRRRRGRSVLRSGSRRLLLGRPLSCGRLLARLRRWLLRRILLFGAFADDGRTAGPRNQNRQRKRCDHKE